MEGSIALKKSIYVILILATMAVHVIPHQVVLFVYVHWVTLEVCVLKGPMNVILTLAITVSVMTLLMVLCAFATMGTLENTVTKRNMTALLILV